MKSVASTEDAKPAEYVNSFWSHGSLDPRVYKTTAKPVEHRGYLIYNRIRSTTPHGGCWDVVKDGMCVGQYAGKTGAMGFVDMLHGQGDAELVAFHQERCAEIMGRALKAA